MQKNLKVSASLLMPIEKEQLLLFAKAKEKSLIMLGMLK
jgi:hypothetical protein